MNFLHNKLLNSSNNYRSWHNYPKHPLWHWIAFLLFVFGSYFYIADQINSYINFTASNLEIAIAAAPTSGLVGYWNFDEGSGATVADSSGNGNNGTLSGGPTWVTGKVGSGALSFDGTNDYINIPSSALYDFAGDFTVSAWVYEPVGSAQSQQGFIKRSKLNLAQFWG